MDSKVVEETRVTRKARRAHPTVTKIALKKTFSEPDLEQSVNKPRTISIFSVSVMSLSPACVSALVDPHTVDTDIRILVIWLFGVPGA